MTKQHQIFHTNVLQTSTNIHNKIQLIFGPLLKDKQHFSVIFVKPFQKSPQVEAGLLSHFSKRKHIF